MCPIHRHIHQMNVPYIFINKFYTGPHTPADTHTATKRKAHKYIYNSSIFNSIDLGERLLMFIASRAARKQQKKNGGKAKSLKRVAVLNCTNIKRQNISDTQFFIVCTFHSAVLLLLLFSRFSFCSEIRFR